jgi:L,D-transpeptidase YbiS
VVDTGRNRLYLKKGDRVIRDAVISSGSGSILKDPSGKRQWIFDTPRGEYRVTARQVAPAWIRPDWAFIEEGETIPRDPRKRVEEGVLGDYALGFGNGYFIHGTLYTRLLGRNVTHGCIRVGDRDLKAVYATADVGTRIYIF